VDPTLAVRAESFEPDAVIVRVPPPDMPELLAALSEAGMRVPLLVPWIPGLSPADLTSRYAGNVLAVRPFATGASPLYTAFERAYQARFGVVPTPAAAYSYDAVHVVHEALEASGLNRAGLRDAMARATGFVGATGAISWNNGGGNRAKPVLIAPRDAVGATPGTHPSPGVASLGGHAR
jgi:ABC-type branched-subunit amino acid transport system substrate-binding protein